MATSDRSPQEGEVPRARHAGAWAVSSARSTRSVGPVPSARGDRSRKEVRSARHVSFFSGCAFAEPPLQPCDHMGRRARASGCLQRGRRRTRTLRRSDSWNLRSRLVGASPRGRPFMYRWSLIRTGGLLSTDSDRDPRRLASPLMTAVREFASPASPSACRDHGLYKAGEGGAGREREGFDATFPASPKREEKEVRRRAILQAVRATRAGNQIPSSSG